MKLSKEVEKQIMERAIAAYPKYAGGVLATDEYVACENAAKDPLKSFEFDEEHLFNLIQIYAEDIEALVEIRPFGDLEITDEQRADIQYSGLDLLVVLVTKDSKWGIETKLHKYID